MVGPHYLFQLQIDFTQRFFVADIAGEDDVGEVGSHDAGHAGDDDVFCHHGKMLEIVVKTCMFHGKCVFLQRQS